MLLWLYAAIGSKCLIVFFPHPFSVAIVSSKLVLPMTKNSVCYLLVPPSRHHLPSSAAVLDRRRSRWGPTGTSARGRRRRRCLSRRSRRCSRARWSPSGWDSKTRTPPPLRWWSPAKAAAVSGAGGCWKRNWQREYSNGKKKHWSRPKRKALLPPVFHDIADENEWNAVCSTPYARFKKPFQARGGCKKGTASEWILPSPLCATLSTFFEVSKEFKLRTPFLQAKMFQYALTCSNRILCSVAYPSMCKLTPQSQNCADKDITRWNIRMKINRQMLLQRERQS